jgi:hypothetical protein
MKKSFLLISYLVMMFMCLPGCSPTPHKTNNQGAQLQQKTVSPSPKRLTNTAQNEAKQNFPGIDDKVKQDKSELISKDIAQERKLLSLPQLEDPIQKQSISKPLFLSTRGISIIAKTTKGKSQKIQLYDYTAALIIGIDRYENLGTTEQLTYAVKDAKGVEKVLRNDFQFDEIVTLHNEQATREKIMQALYGFRSLTSDGGIFVYFAGHGITIPGTLRGNDLGYLVPYDGTLNSVEMYKNISMQQVKSDICMSITAKHVFFVFDACFAGLMLDTRATLSRPSRDFSYLQAITNEPVRQVLTAGSKGETVLDGGPGEHSVFTGRFIEALENVEDYITARELAQYLKKRVHGDAAARGHKQRPTDGEIYGTGDFVFVPDLEKRGRKIGAEVEALEAEMAELKRLKDEATKAQNQSMERQIERLQLIKEAELKLAQTQKRQKEEALKYQRQSELEVEKLEKDRIQREVENEKRLNMLRIEAEKMRQDLNQDLTGGATVKSAISELKKIKEKRDKIELDFSTELRKQSKILAGFYDKRIDRIMDIPPWDKEFETKREYHDRLAKAQLKAAPIKKAKEEKLASLQNELQTALEKQISPLDKQMKTLEAKRFTLPVSHESFKFVRYYLKLQMMLVNLSTDGKSEKFFIKLEPSKAREFKRHPELLVPEIQIKPTLIGAKREKIIFNGAGKSETYTFIPLSNISDDGRFVTFPSGVEVDTKNGLKITEREGEYVAYANGIVWDTNTGLEWKAGPDIDMNWKEATTWVENLKLNGGGWRVPSINELKGLCKSATGGCNITRLLKNTNYNTWPSENESSSTAIVFSLKYGVKFGGYRGYSPNRRAFAVRSWSDGSDDKKIMEETGAKNVDTSGKYNKMKTDRVYVGYVSGVVKDPSTGLEWVAGSDRDTNWYQARTWVKNLRLNGGGWRMPTMDELQILFSKRTPLLKTTGLWVWSGETKDASGAWGYNLFRHIGRFWDERSVSSGSRVFAVRRGSN